MKEYYTTDGDVRGSCDHKHRTLDAAQKCKDKDSCGCASQGGYSDRYIYRVSEDGREIVTDYDC